MPLLLFLLAEGGGSSGGGKRLLMLGLESLLAPLGPKFLALESPAGCDKADRALNLGSSAAPELEAECWFGAPFPPSSCCACSIVKYNNLCLRDCRTIRLEEKSAMGVAGHQLWRQVGIHRNSIKQSFIRWALPWSPRGESLASDDIFVSSDIVS